MRVRVRVKVKVKVKVKVMVIVWERCKPWQTREWCWEIGWE